MRSSDVRSCVVSEWVGAIFSCGISMGQAPNPPSISAPLLETPPIDRNALIMEDLQTSSGPARLAIVQPFSLDARFDGLTAQLEDGSYVWSARIRAPGATWLRLVLDGWHPPTPTDLVVYDPARPHASRRSLSPTVNRNDDYWSPIFFTNEVVLECKWRSAVPPSELAILSMSRIVCGYRGFDLPTPGNADLPSERGGPRGDPLPCQLDPTCWTRSAELFEAVGIWLRCNDTDCVQCSGSLVNREYQFTEPPIPPLNLGDDAALFLTASHCGAAQNNLNTIVVIFGFHTANCNNSPPDLNSLVQSRATAMLVDLPDVDIQLFGIERFGLPAKRNKYSLDWWATPFFELSDALSIYHPLGSHLRLADCRKTLNIDRQPARQVNGTCADASNYFVRFDVNGRPEAGADGAPVFRYRADHEYQPIMAVMSCDLFDPPNCDNATVYSGARLDHAASATYPFRFPLPTAYIDRTHTGNERGSESEPMRGVARGAYVLDQLNGNHSLMIAPGNYNERLVLDFHCVVQKHGSGASVIIGQP